MFLQLKYNLISQLRHSYANAHIVFVNCAHSWTLKALILELWKCIGIFIAI